MTQDEREKYIAAWTKYCAGKPSKHAVCASKRVREARVETLVARFPWRREREMEARNGMAA